MILSHRIRLYPNNVQTTYLRRACGIRRFAYNWALAESRRLYEAGERTSGFDLVKRFNAIKHEQFPWTSEVTKWAPQKAIQDSYDALKKWWSGQAKAPVFKKKGKCRDSFYVGEHSFRVDADKVRIDKLGWVRMAQSVRFPGIVKFVTISSKGDKWFASFSVQIDDSYEYPHACKTQAVVGVDVGTRDLVVLSDGTKVGAPRGLVHRERKLRKLSKALSRTQKGSSGRKKAKAALAECHRKVKDARRDVTHKITSALVRENRWIGLETLNVQGMVKNHHLARSISDAAFGEIRQQVTYKAALAGSHVVLADRFYPSSKTCSCCGHVVDSLPLRVREWLCSGCGSILDRDVNAAKNLMEVARRYRDTLNAGGEETVRPIAERREAASMNPEMGVCSA